MSGQRFVHNIAPSDEREKDDFYPTPPEATKSLLAIEDIGPNVWEPACGDGAMSRVLEASGRDVVSTDLVDRGFGKSKVDFLLERRLLAPDVVSNPPFKLAEKFVHHALVLGADTVAFLMRLAWLEGEGRKRRIYDRYPPARVHISSRRITMFRPGWDGNLESTGMIAFAWFVWRRDHVGPTELTFFDWMELAPECAREKTPAAATAEAMPLFS